MTWATSVPILVFLGLSVLYVGPMNATYGQIDVRRRQSDAHHRLSFLVLSVCVFVAGGVCYHDNSKLRASIFTKLGLYVSCDHLQLIKFWPSCAPGSDTQYIYSVPGPREGGLRRGEIFGSPYYSARAVFASL